MPLIEHLLNRMNWNLFLHPHTLRQTWICKSKKKKNRIASHIPLMRKWFDTVHLICILHITFKRHCFPFPFQYLLNSRCRKEGKWRDYWLPIILWQMLSLLPHWISANTCRARIFNPTKSNTKVQGPQWLPRWLSATLTGVSISTPRAMLFALYTATHFSNVAMEHNSPSPA